MLVCKLLGHKWDYNSQEDLNINTVPVKTCKRCGKEEVLWKIIQARRLELEKVNNGTQHF